MRFVILGAGAVGGTIGGLLHDSGHEVVLVARGAHAAAMRADGLLLATPSRSMTVRVDVVDDPSALVLDGDDVLVLATKTQDTTALIDDVADLRVDGRPAAAVLPVFCAQNGVANERIAARRFADVHGMVVMLPAVLLEPGRIEAQGEPYSGLLDVGRWPTGVTSVDRAVADALTASNFVSRATDDVMRWKYAKLLRNLGNAIEALCGHDLDDDERAMAVVQDLDRRLRAEAETCFAAAGIDWVSDEEWGERRRDQVRHAPVEGRSRMGGSSWQSLARRLGTIEADYLNGEVALLGRRYDVPTPVNVTLQLLANRAARQGAPPGSLRPQDIVEAIADQEGSPDD
ncbi:MAG TPA: 2-dehydropantoate 2-reductase N-terminal domain-containing protein [Mycobacteriales bacterium]|nr:2-dehydropantoate 2-reductase N-terminal domain-containing protein [Mycobacteriales bacterium]